MKGFKLLTLASIMCMSSSVFAGNWLVHNGWCQTQTEDGMAMVMLKKDKLGVMGLGGCPYGNQQMKGSLITINGDSIPTTHMCNNSTNYKPIEVEVHGINNSQAQAKKAIISIAKNEVSRVNAFGGSMTFTRGDMLTVCKGYVDFIGETSREKADKKVNKKVNKKVSEEQIISAAKDAYMKKNSDADIDDVSFSIIEKEGNVYTVEAFDAAFKTYDDVLVTLSDSGSISSVKVYFKGR